MKQLDMIGQPCPIPVVQAKKALAEKDADGVVVLVDNMTAVQNLQRMATSLDYGYAYVRDADDRYTVTVTRNGAAAPTKADIANTECIPEPMPQEGLVVLIGSSKLGEGAEELGRILMKGFVFSLTELSPPPSAVLFLNSGAYLTAEGANTVADLEVLAGKGTRILTCGTCSNYYELKEKLAVGEITDMMGITNTLATAGRLISL